MRNTLKFSVFGTLLCAMSIIFSNGYSMNNNNSSTESNEELIRKVENVIGNDPSNPYTVIIDKNGNRWNGHGQITEEEMERYNKIMREKKQKLNTNKYLQNNHNPLLLDKDGNFTFAKKSENENNESDEEFLSRVKNVLDYTIVQDKKTGDYSNIRGRVTQGEMDRYNRLMYKRKNDSSSTKFSIDDKKESDVFGFTKQYEEKTNKKLSNSEVEIISRDDMEKYYKKMKENSKRKKETLTKLTEELYEAAMSLLCTTNKLVGLEYKFYKIANALENIIKNDKSYKKLLDELYKNLGPLANIIDDLSQNINPFVEKFFTITSNIEKTTKRKYYPNNNS